jgi:predicted N-acetyltransferase YhbS
LVTVATHPEVQGQGRASELIRSGLERCDSTRDPCFLTCNDMANVPFYERFGFKVVHTVDLPDGGPQVAMMLR